MSQLGVSQLEFWLDSSKQKKIGTPPQTPHTPTKTGGEGATYLSYDVFMALSILGGFLALDHLYLRSPLTFLAKIFVNILFFGVWWIYDATQAVFNDNVVKVFGLGIPSLGPKGIAAGVLANDVPDKKHMRFFIYAIGLIFTGLLGVDSFLLGDKQSGLIRLFSFFTVFFAPIAIIWWLYNMFNFFVNTKAVMEANHDYFGAPPPQSLVSSYVSSLVSKIPFLGRFIEPIEKIKNTAVKIAEESAELAAASVTNPDAVFNTVLREPLQEAANIAGPAIKPVTNTAQSAINTVDSVVDTAREAISLGRNALNTGATITEEILRTVDDTAKAATSALALAPMAASISTGLTPDAVSKAKLNLTGGTIATSSNVLPFLLLGTFGVIVASGFYLSYRRSKQKNVKPDDAPPQPGVL